MKFSHTRNRALGPEPIPAYSHRWLFKSSSCSMLPLLYVRPAVTFPAEEHHRTLTSTKLYCLMTEAHRCEQLARRCYSAFPPSWTHNLMIASPTLYHCTHSTTWRLKHTSIGSTMPCWLLPRPSPPFQPIFCSRRLPTLSSLMPCAVGCSNLNTSHVQCTTNLTKLQMGLFEQ